MASANTAEPNSGKVLSPNKLAHVVLRTGNFKAMVAFYKAFLGAHASHETDALAFLTYDEEHHRIAIIHVPGTTPKVRSSAGLEHIAFTFSTLGDLLLSYRQRRALGIVPVWSVNHGPTTSLYYQDPDGNQIETQVDNFDSAGEASEFMVSEDFAENPFGVDVDPEDLIARLEKGESEEALKKRARAGPRDFASVPLLNPPAPDVRETYGPVETVHG